MGQVQQQLATIWTELLKGDAVTDDSDFFDSGGTSIAAVYLAAAIQESFSVPFDALEVVVERTFSRLASLIITRLTPVP